MGSPRFSGSHARQQRAPGGEEQLTAQRRVWIPQLRAGMLLDKHSLEKLSFVFFLFFFFFLLLFSPLGKTSTDIGPDS